MNWIGSSEKFCVFLKVIVLYVLDSNWWENPKSVAFSLFKESLRLTHWNGCISNWHRGTWFEYAAFDSAITSEQKSRPETVPNKEYMNTIGEWFSFWWYLDWKWNHVTGFSVYKWRNTYIWNVCKKFMEEISFMCFLKFQIVNGIICMFIFTAMTMSILISMLISKKHFARLTDTICINISNASIFIHMHWITFIKRKKCNQMLQ